MVRCKDPRDRQVQVSALSYLLALLLWANFLTSLSFVMKNRDKHQVPPCRVFLSIRWATPTQSSPSPSRTLFGTCVTSLNPPLLHSDFLSGWKKPGLLSWSMISTGNTLVHEVRDVLTILNFKREEMRISIPLISKSFLAPHVNMPSLFPSHIHQPAIPIYQEHREGLPSSDQIKSYSTTVIHLHFIYLLHLYTISFL